MKRNWPRRGRSAGEAPLSLREVLQQTPPIGVKAKILTSRVNSKLTDFVTVSGREGVVNPLNDQSPI
jgi:hypothetical protein